MYLIPSFSIETDNKSCEASSSPLGCCKLPGRTTRYFPLFPLCRHFHSFIELPSSSFLRYVFQAGELNARHAMIVGGTSIIGKAVASRLALQGASVTLVDT